MSGIYSKKILIIEQDQALKDSLVSLFVAEGYDAYHESVPGAGLRRVRELRPEILLLDLQLSEDIGYAILEGIKQMRENESYHPFVYVVTRPEKIDELKKALSYTIQGHFSHTEFEPSAVVARITSELTKPEPVSEGLLQQYSLLIVEDDKFLRDLMQSKFENTGIHIHVAIDGEQGLATALREKPDIMLLDILLPGMDGFSVLETIRKNPDLATTIIIMLSNFGQREDLEKAKKLGANRFLVKSNVNLDEIIDNVKELLELRHLASQPS